MPSEIYAHSIGSSPSGGENLTGAMICSSLPFANHSSKRERNMTREMATVAMNDTEAVPEARGAEEK